LKSDVSITISTNSKSSLSAPKADKVLKRLAMRPGAPFSIQG
jgi:hypothetical protein